ncbi:hypothetical protein Are01nite_67640 [Actinoplanes regularis]|nr:hypothetical protein Are01nite_67640 [Actinoplanes regularis]
MGIGSVSMNSYRIDLQKRLTAAGLNVDFVGSQHNGDPAAANLGVVGLQHNGDPAAANLGVVGSRRDGDPATVDLDHEGHSGWTIASVAEQANGLLAAYRPDAVLLQIGTNDLRTEAGGVGATDRLSALIDQIEAAAPAAEIFVAEITGTRSASRASQQSRTEAYNAEVPGIVAAKGTRVHLVDQSTVKGIDIRDGLHPNDFGYAKMSWNWYRALAHVYGLSPAGPDDPYTATRGNFCHLVDGDPGPAWSAYFDCRWYQRNLVTTTVPGGPAKVWAWQARRPRTATRKVRVDGRYVTRTVTTTEWVTFDPDRLNR